MGAKMNPGIKTNNHAAESEKSFSNKTDFKVVWLCNGHAAIVGAKGKKQIQKHTLGLLIGTKKTVHCVNCK